jgi:hypothetical protein
MKNRNPTNTLEKKTKVDSDVAEKFPVPAPVVTPVVLLLFESR